MINQYSIAKTLDAVNEVFFRNEEVPKDEIEAITKWLCKRQEKKGSYKGTFRPAEIDHNIRLFTGEKLQTQLAKRNILTQEATRVLVLSKINSSVIKSTIKLADEWMENSCYVTELCTLGECKHQGIGYLRYLISNGDSSESRKVEYLNALSQHRDSKYKWKGFPFYFTIMVLSEFKHPLSLNELKFAAPACERNLKRLRNRKEVYSQRRKFILNRVLNIVNHSLESFILA